MASWSNTSLRASRDTKHCKPTVLGASVQFDCAACQSRRLFQNLARSRAVLVGEYYWVRVTCNVPFKRHLSTPLHVTPFDPFFFCFPTEYIDCTLLRAPFSPELLRAVPVCSRLHGSSFLFFTRARSLFLCSELTWSAHKPHKKREPGSSLAAFNVLFLG